MALLVTVVVVVVVVALFTLGPKRLRYWRCGDRVERATPRAAVDGYYEYCWTRAELRTGLRDGHKEGGEWADWFEVKEYGIHKDGSAVAFLFVGRRTAASGWVVLSEATGP